MHKEASNFRKERDERKRKGAGHCVVIVRQDGESFGMKDLLCFSWAVVLGRQNWEFKLGHFVDYPKCEVVMSGVGTKDVEELIEKGALTNP